jgi:hypothetical protein
LISNFVPHQDCREVRQFLLGRSHDDRLGKHAFQSAGEVDNERRTVKEQQGLRPAHARTLASGQHDGGNVEYRLSAG